METIDRHQEKREQAYQKARNRVDELKAFYSSLLSYFIVMPILIYIWYEYSYYSIQWFWFPLVFWGLSLLFKAYTVFGKNSTFAERWEQKKIEQYMNEEINNTL